MDPLGRSSVVSCNFWVSNLQITIESWKKPMNIPWTSHESPEKTSDSALQRLDGTPPADGPVLLTAASSPASLRRWAPRWAPRPAAVGRLRGEIMGKLHGEIPSKWRFFSGRIRAEKEWKVNYRGLELGESSNAEMRIHGFSVVMSRDLTW